MHFSELLRAQSISREILLQPSTLLALRNRCEDESAQHNMFWSQPLHSASPSYQRYLPNTHVISAKAFPSGPTPEKPSMKVSRIVSPARPAWVPSSVAVTGAAESKRRTGPR
jgi:hypothetical protein